ncbi:tumor necrosis factor alpha-induced protein 2-like isoform X3 [Oryx dammah]|uniref:tumor necrosis factor alpha-induced protein 2-like isoform X3 n=1 Tax=Oryx dammah TaxID=59534 RepID=UPI001A9B1E66|nr:tumor necrosis factor alpha-induced protein 2-like isoform X3 [Oryx dammah]XP_040092341.1 tumor necrosis factor alpha-induced protein 2-like isoform X3 [Oryx dammah]XP_040092342.1 tumor necrosis factor alpha-induced protein 2-like isoform X3 [Oryx dammah]
MLKMLTFFQGLPGQQPMSGAPDFPRSAQKLPSTSEAESEASMSEASSEDLVPSLEVEVAPDRDEEEADKKKKKSKGLATMFSVFTKGRKKKGQPSLAETDGESESSPRPPDQLPTVEELKADLERGQLEAARPLLALELELQEAAAAGRASEEELVRRQSKVEALYALLRDQVLGPLRRPLEAAPERLRQALAVLAEQERQDQAAAAAGPPGCPGLAATRPRGWLQLWRDGVAQEAAERLSRRPAADAEGRTEAERAFLHMGRTMKEDLEAVVERLKPLFPAGFRVVAAYAESYHAEFAAQLAALTQFELCPRDTSMLLLWVQNLYPNDILNSPKLSPELQGVRLGTLLPPTQIRQLEASFLSNEVASVRELTARALELESERWTKDEAPQRLDGRCHSELAIDIIQIISQGQDKAESITLDLGTQIKPFLLEELARFLRSYQRAFDEFLERCRQLRNYRANVIANINNCLPFQTSVEQRWQTPPDLRSSLLRPLNELKSRGFDTLLQSLFGDLKPLFKRFTQTRWAAPQQTLEEIVSIVDKRMPEFSELQDCFQEVRGCWAAGGGTRRQACVCAHPDALFRSGIRPSLDPGLQGGGGFPWPCPLAHPGAPGGGPPAPGEGVHRPPLQAAPGPQDSGAAAAAGGARPGQRPAHPAVLHPERKPRPPPHPPMAVGCPPAPSASLVGQPLWASPNLMRSDPSLSGPPGALPGRAGLFQQACACRAPRPPGCTTPSRRLPRSFACKTPVPSRSRWPRTPPCTLTSARAT